jgi:hypothetical protein
MTHTACAAVTYRASAGDRDVAIQLAIAPDRATLGDAWARLTAAFGPIDPRTIEIEIRPARIRRSAARSRHRDPERVVPMARRLEIQSLDAC